MDLMIFLFLTSKMEDNEKRMLLENALALKKELIHAQKLLTGFQILTGCNKPVKCCHPECESMMIWTQDLEMYPGTYNIDCSAMKQCQFIDEKYVKCEMSYCDKHISQHMIAMIPIHLLESPQKGICLICNSCSDRAIKAKSYYIPPLDITDNVP
jgi:hypothetical protein